MSSPKSDFKSYKNTVLLFMLCVAVVITGNQSFRYKLIEPILEHGQFPGNQDQWIQRGEPRNARIQGNDIALQSDLIGAIGGLYRKFPIANEDSEARQVIRVTGRVVRTVDDPEAINLTLGQGTIAVLDFALDDAGARKVHILLDITHAQSDTKLDKVVPIPSPVEAMSLGFLHREAKDSATVTDFEIQRLSERKGYRWSLVPILILGFVLLYHFVKLTLSNFNAIRLFSLLAAAFIFLILLLPQMQSVVANGYDQLRQTSWGSAFPASFDIFSAGHLVMFSVLAALAWSLAESFQQAKTLTIFQILLVTVASEGAQQHIGGRTASAADLGYNLLGILIGTLVYFLYARYFASSNTALEPLE